MQNNPTPPIAEQAKLILELYDLRREEKMREARSWLWNFKPKTIDDVKAAMHGPDSAKLRMVCAYWDMAAALVNHNAISSKFFHDCNGEHIWLYAKLEPLLPEIHKSVYPGLLSNIKTMVDADPKLQEEVKRAQTTLKTM
jgi:hypothetical protein